VTRMSLLYPEIAKEMENQSWGKESLRVTFTPRKETCQAVALIDLRIRQAENIKYFELY
jgi:hypothetical protein